MPSAQEKKSIVVAGGGPAGLRAAEVAASGGARVTLIEAGRSIGRKFLIAGKSGLNLTNAEEEETFRSRFSGPAERWEKLLADFDPDAMRKWAGELGFDTFVSSGGKVFPEPMKAGSLLRSWKRKLESLGVTFRTRERLTGLEPGGEEGVILTLESGAPLSCDAAILAFGGASWPETGSDGSWVTMLSEHGVRVHPFLPANCGWEVAWPEEFLAEADGLPLKNVTVRAGRRSRTGELIITRYGLEGGPLYHLGPVLREMTSPAIELDLKPSLTEKQVLDRLAKVKRNYVREAKRRLRLGDGAAALLKHLPHLGPWRNSASLAACIKACPVPLRNPRPIAEAISTAGGVSWDELDESLMLRKVPGVFLAGEMIDWEAPTGGYLLQGCFATGTAAARGALSRTGGAG